jgi:hypothetical protein
MISNHLLNLEGKRVKAVVDGQPIRRRLLFERVGSEMLSPVPVDAEALSSWGGD